METIYFKISYANSQKFVKTNSDGCEIVLISPFGNKHWKYRNPYPMAEENDYEHCPKKEFTEALKKVKPSLKPV